MAQCTNMEWLFIKYACKEKSADLSEVAKQIFALQVY